MCKLKGDCDCDNSNADKVTFIDPVEVVVWNHKFREFYVKAVIILIRTISMWRILWCEQMHNIINNNVNICT